MEKTTDYNKFKKLIYNRPVDQKRVTELINAIKDCNLLDNYPIMCTPDLEIIDGQHRFEAAKRLSLPVYYVIKKDFLPEDLTFANNHKAWSKEDYFNFYVLNEYTEYLKLKKMMDAHNLGFREAYYYMNSNRRTDFADQFIRGKYVHNTQREQYILEKIKDCRAAIDFISAKLPEARIYVNFLIFRLALIRLLNHPAVDLKVFKSKLEYNLHMMRKCSTAKDFYQLLVKIYNWRNRYPINNHQYDEITNEEI